MILFLNPVTVNGTGVPMVFFPSRINRALSRALHTRADGQGGASRMKATHNVATHFTFSFNIRKGADRAP